MEPRGSSYGCLVCEQGKQKHFNRSSCSVFCWASRRLLVKGQWNCFSLYMKTDTLFLNFDVQQHFFSKKRSVRHSIDWVTGPEGKGKSRCECAAQTMQWAGCCLCDYVIFLQNYAGKIVRNGSRLCDLAEHLPWPSLQVSKATSRGCLKKQDVSLGLKLFTWIWVPLGADVYVFQLHSLCLPYLRMFASPCRNLPCRKKIPLLSRS